jgi:hypothetical protein
MRGFLGAFLLPEALPWGNGAYTRYEVSLFHFQSSDILTGAAFFPDFGGILIVVEAVIENTNH